MICYGSPVAWLAIAIVVGLTGCTASEGAGKPSPATPPPSDLSAAPAPEVEKAADAPQVDEPEADTNTAPTVVITLPSAGDVVTSSELNVHFEGTDADGDDLTYTVALSLDGGTRWRAIGMGGLKGKVAYPLRFVGSTTEAMIQVHASDGSLTGLATVGPFTIGSKGPTVSIIEPRDGSSFSVRERIFFKISVYDAKDHSRPAGGITWRSDIDGPLGRSAKISRPLSKGTHTITVAATNSDGLTSEASARVTVY